MGVDTRWAAPLARKQALGFCHFILKHLQRKHLLRTGRVFRVFIDPVLAGWLIAAGNCTGAVCVH
jgi:hypothetical protein